MKRPPRQTAERQTAPVPPPDITLGEARFAARLVALSLAVGDMTEHVAYNHIADIGVLSREYEQLMKYFEGALTALGGMKAPRPIPMRLPCPGTVPDGRGGQKICGELHIDEGEFETKPHHTHSCQACGATWRPAVPHTLGVRFLPGFKNEQKV